MKRLDQYSSFELVVLQTAVNLMTSQCPEDRIEILKEWEWRIQEAAITAKTKELYTSTGN